MGVLGPEDQFLADEQDHNRKILETTEEVCKQAFAGSWRKVSFKAKAMACGFCSSQDAQAHVKTLGRGYLQLAPLDRSKESINTPTHEHC